MNWNDSIRKYLYFLLVSYLTAITFETVANTIGDGKLFKQPLPSLIVFFLVWYGLIYTITYLIFRKSPLWQPVLCWVIVGPIAEIVVFRRSNLIVDPIIYGIMFLIPFYVYHRYIDTSVLPPKKVAKAGH